MSRRAPATGPGQDGLFTDEEIAEIDPARKAERTTTPGPCLYSSAAPGLPALNAEREAWAAEHGNFGSSLRSHGWAESGGPIFNRTELAARCAAVVLSAHREPNDTCPGHQATVAWYSEDRHLVYRGCCLGCDWRGEPVHDCENGAAEDALDHAWPGWRDLPVVQGQPGYGATKVQLGGWETAVTRMLPPGWLEGGGPVRTMRKPFATRHVPKGTPHGGYDTAANWIELTGAADPRQAAR